MSLLSVPEYVVLQNPEEVSDVLFGADPEYVAIDTETTTSMKEGVKLLEDQIVVWSFAFTDFRACCTRYSLAGLVDYFREKWRTAKLVFQNLPFDMHMLANAGILLYDWFRAEQLFDTLNMDSLLNPNGVHDLKSLSKDRLGVLYKSFREQKFKLVPGMSTIPPDLADYASLDAWATLRLGDQMIPALQERKCVSKNPPVIDGRKLETMFDYYQAVEQPLTRVLWHSCRVGIQIDEDYMWTVAPELEKKCTGLSTEICSMIGRVVNPNSVPQMGKLLFEELHYTPPEKSKTKKGKQSLDEEVLEKLEVQRPGVPGKLLKFRKLTHLKSTYAVGTLKRLVDGRLHTSFKQYTATGRLSSSNPNLQNIPRSGEPSIRRAFIQTPGYRFLVFDYSQVELRVLAHLSGAETLLKPLCTGEDLHARTASQLFDISYDLIYAAKKAKEPTPEQELLLEKRSIAKTINFGTVYGLSPYGLQMGLILEGMDVTYDEAKEYLDRYWRTHADLKEFLDTLVKSVNVRGFVPTLLGRTRPIGEIFSRTGRVNRNAKNEATNTPVQGSAAEIVKLKMLELFSDPVFTEDFGGRILLQVHDELVLEVLEPFAEKAFPYVKALLETPPIPLRVPLIVDGKIVSNWGEGH